MPQPASSNTPLSNQVNQQTPNPLMFENVYVQSLERMFSKQYNAGEQVVQIEVLTVGTSPACLYPNSKVCRGGTMMNLSNTDTITLGGGGISNVGHTTLITAGNGFILNPAAAAGQGGGTWNFGNIDLGSITAVTSTNTGQKLAVVYYL